MQICILFFLDMYKLFFVDVVVVVVAKNVQNAVEYQSIYDIYYICKMCVCVCNIHLTL